MKKQVSIPLKATNSYNITLRSFHNDNFKIKIRKGDIVYKNGDEYTIKKVK